MTLEGVRIRHVRVVTCSQPLPPLHLDPGRPDETLPCGYEDDAPIHDTHEDVAKRAPLGWPESYRHAFVAGEPEDQCRTCRDEWPCDAAALLDLGSALLTEMHAIVGCDPDCERNFHVTFRDLTPDEQRAVLGAP